MERSINFILEDSFIPGCIINYLQQKCIGRCTGQNGRHGARFPEKFGFWFLSAQHV